MRLSIPRLCTRDVFAKSTSQTSFTKPDSQVIDWARPRTTRNVVAKLDVITHQDDELRSLSVHTCGPTLYLPDISESVHVNPFEISENCGSCVICPARTEAERGRSKRPNRKRGAASNGSCDHCNECSFSVSFARVPPFLGTMRNNESRGAKCQRLPFQPAYHKCTYPAWSLA